MNNDTCVSFGMDFGVELMEEYAVLLAMIEDNLGMAEILIAHHPEGCWAEKPYYYMVAMYGEIKEFWNSCTRPAPDRYLEPECSMGAAWVEPIENEEVESQNIWGVAQCGDNEYWEHWEQGFEGPMVPMEFLPY